MVTLSDSPKPRGWQVIINQYGEGFLPTPELDPKGWRSRAPLEQFVNGNVLGGPLKTLDN
jgi:hypothetical protein